MKHILFILLLVTVASSCQKSSESSTAISAETKAFSAEREAFFGNLMAPAEAAAQIQFSAAEFNASLMNNPAIYAQYANNEVKAAANLGVYLADLNYSIAYKQPVSTKEYFAAAHELSKAIGGEKETLEFLTKRYHENIAQNDSVKSIVTDLLAKSTASLKGTEKEKLAGITMAAYQIESLHLILGLLETYPKDMLPSDARQVILVPLFTLTLRQRANVHTIYNFLRTFGDVQNPDKNPNFPFYTNALAELIGIYDKLNVDEKITNNKGAELLNDTVVEELSEKVNAIRDKIVSIE